MKKVLCIAVMAVLGLVNVNAQDVKFGAKAGLNLSNVSAEQLDEDNKVGFNFGAFAQIGLSEKITFQPEMLFSSQGYKSEISEPDNDYFFEQKLEFNYLNVPLMFRYAVLDKLGLEFGPQVGFLLSASGEGEETLRGETETFDQDVKELLKSTDFGFNFGASYDVSENIIIGARYNLGLSDIRDENVDTNKVSNTVFSFSLGYRF